MIASYPKVYAIGNRWIADLFRSPVDIQEKVDGSQISFGFIGGVLHVRSKGQELDLSKPDGMFHLAVQQITARAAHLRDNYIYRGEYLRSAKHNALQYSRVPEGNIAIFDVQYRGGDHVWRYVQPSLLYSFAEEAGFYAVPVFHSGADSPSVDYFKELLRRESFLGGALIEGVVVKNYDVLDVHGQPLFGKYVSEAFKETHAGAWRQDNPSKGDILERIAEDYSTPARFAKASIHLLEQGRLEYDPRDIPKLRTEVWDDVLAECKDEMKEQLWRWAEGKLKAHVLRPIPQWWKDELLRQGVEA